MNKLNHICLTITQLDKQPSLLSQIVANALKQRRRKEDEFDRARPTPQPVEVSGEVILTRLENPPGNGMFTPYTA